MKTRLAWRCIGLACALAIAVSGCGRGESKPSTTDVITDTGENSRIRATLAHACLQAGEQQVLTVRGKGDPPVRFESTYADGESGRPEPVGAGYGGSGFALRTDEKEPAAKASWEISEEAPPGLVSVRLSALLPGDEEKGGPDEALTRLRLRFRLVGAKEECP